METLSSQSKVISCRMPFADYIELLKKVSEKGINVNDFLLSKLYCDSEKDVNNFTEKESNYLQEIANLNDDYEETKSQLIDTMREAELLRIKVSELQKNCKTSDLKATEQAESIGRMNRICQQKEKEIEDLKATIQRLQKQLRTQDQALQALQSENGSLESANQDLQEQIKEAQERCSDFESENEDLSRKINQRKSYKNTYIENREREFKAKEDEANKRWQKSLNDLKESAQKEKKQILEALTKTIQEFKIGSFENTTKKVAQFKEDLLQVLG